MVHEIPVLFRACLNQALQSRPLAEPEPPASLMNKVKRSNKVIPFSQSMMVRPFFIYVSNSKGFLENQFFSFFFYIFFFILYFFPFFNIFVYFWFQKDSSFFYFYSYFSYFYFYFSDFSFQKWFFLFLIRHRYLFKKWLFDFSSRICGAIHRKCKYACRSSSARWMSELYRSKNAQYVRRKRENKRTVCVVVFLLHKKDFFWKRKNSCKSFLSSASRSGIIMEKNGLVWRRRHCTPLDMIILTRKEQAVAVPVPLYIPRFQVWGSNLSQGKFFFFFFPFPNFLQRSINGEYLLSIFIAWLIDRSCHWSHIYKKMPWLGLEPLTWKRGICSGSGIGTAHAVEENRESALWLPIASHSVPMDAH